MTGDQLPKGLSPRLLRRLRELIESWDQSDGDAAALIRSVESYWLEIQSASATKPLLDRDLAGKIRVSLVEILSQWEEYSAKDQSWIAAAVIYFIESDDDEHDFDSPVGFDDDVEVVNAVVKLVGRHDLVI